MKCKTLILTCILLVFFSLVVFAYIRKETHGIEMSSTTGAEIFDGFNITVNSTCNSIKACYISVVQLDEQNIIPNVSIFNGTKRKSVSPTSGLLVSAVPNANLNATFNYRVKAGVYYVVCGKNGLAGQKDTYKDVSGSYPYSTGFLKWMRRIHNNGEATWVTDQTYMTCIEAIYLSIQTPDTNAPKLSAPICTSCIPGKNLTSDSTPTINVTCTDTSGCLKVRISNSSTQSYTQMTSSRDCTVGQGNTWVCTTINGDAIPNGGILYFTASDINGNSHSKWNISIPVSVDISAPAWSNNRTMIANTNLRSKFNVTWVDTRQMKNVSIEHNISMPIRNYTMNNISGYPSVYNFSINITVAGSYYWISYGRDIVNNINKTKKMYFSVVSGAAPPSHDYCAIPTTGTYNVTTWCNITTPQKVIGMLNCSGKLNISSNLNVTGNCTFSKGCDTYIMKGANLTCGN